MKIVMFNTLYHPNFVGGAERSVQNLAESITSKGHEVIVVSTTDKEDHVSKTNNVLVYYVNTHNIYWGFDEQDHHFLKKTIWHTVDSLNLFISNKIRVILKKEKPDIVHTNNISGFSVNIWNLIYEEGISIVHTLRDYHLLCPNVTMFKNGENCIGQCTMCKIYSIPKKKLSNKVNTIVGISDYILQKHLELGYFKKTVFQKIIGNDVGEIIQKERKFNPKKITFGYIGQLTKNKGIELLLTVFSKINNYTNWDLVIAGKGDEKYTDFLKSIIPSSNVTFIGKVKPDNFYSKIDVLIVPSLWQEPFGRVVVEGLKQGKMVLGSNRGGIIDLLPPDNLFEPNEIDLYSVIIRILESEKVYSFDKYVEINVSDMYINLFKNILITDR